MARHSVFALFAVGALLVPLLPVDATAQERSQRRAQRAQPVEVIPQRKPMLAVVGLREQRVTIYDANGARMSESPVSTGIPGNETPPGVFSIVQKNIDHRSNLYDDAHMPYMQRLTWTGIAMHAGVVPGYPASKGCVRLPESFARQLFNLTDMGMRVVIAREAIAPSPIGEPAMFKRDASAPSAGMAVAQPVRLVSTGPDIALPLAADSLSEMRARVSALEAELASASRRAKDLRNPASKTRDAVKPAERALSQAEAALAKAEADITAAAKIVEAGEPKKRLAGAQKTVETGPARVEAARRQIEKARANLEARRAAAEQAEQALATANAKHAQLREALEKAKQDMSPVSVFVSRKTQRIYIRKAFHPLFEAPLTIRDADQPIGTFVFTAHEPADGSRRLNWSVVSLYKDPTNIEPAPPRAKSSAKQSARVEMTVTDVGAAEAALARLDVPADVAARISEIVLPGASLIISDEPPSIETGKDTDFVVVMSGEPQGALANRKPQPKPVPVAMPYAGNYYWGSGPSNYGGSYGNNFGTSSRGGAVRRTRPPGNTGGGLFWFN